MRKLVLISLLVCLLLILSGCSDTYYTYALVTADGIETEPYFNWLYSQNWSGHGMMAADTFNYLPRNLPKIEEKIPTVTFRDDISIQYRRDVNARHISVYDEEYNLAALCESLSDLSSLETGKYYVVISAEIQGRYVIRAGMHESTGGDLVFILEK